jgi:hypothetical protein
LVGCDSTGSNAFFVRQDSLAGRLISLSPTIAYYPDARFLSDIRQDGNLTSFDQFEVIQHLEFVEIP